MMRTEPQRQGSKLWKLCPVAPQPQGQEPLSPMMYLAAQRLEMPGTGFSSRQQEPCLLRPGCHQADIFFFRLAVWGPE